MTHTPGEIQQWLRKQPWWEAFKRNYHTIQKSDFRTFTELLQKSWNEPIAPAFPWDLAPEGFEFWKDVDKQFIKYYYGE